MTIYPLFTVHTLRPFYMFSNVLDFIKAEYSVYQNVQYFIRSKSLFWILPQLDILCTSAMKRYYAKNDNSPFKCRLSRVLEFMVSRKTCYRVVWTSVWSIPYSGELATKIVSTRLPRHLSSEVHPVTLLCPVSEMQQKACQTDCWKEHWWCLGYTARRWIVSNDC